MEPITTVLTGLALARSALNTAKEIINTGKDVKDVADAIGSIFEGQRQFQKKRFAGGLKNVAAEMIEAKNLENELYALSVQIDMTYGNGFFQSIKDEYNKRLREQKEQAIRDRIARRKKLQQIFLWGLLIAALGIVGVILFVIISRLRG